MSKRVTPAERRKAARARATLMAGTVNIERRFTVAVRGIMAGFHDAMLRGVEVAGRAMTTDAAGPPKDPKAAVKRVTDQLLPQIGPKVAAAHKAMASALERNYDKSMGGILPITFKAQPAKVKAAAELARQDSIKYVTDAARSYASQVVEVFGEAEDTIGLRWEELRDRLLERADVSESRAELIARDQTLKLNAAINQTKQQAAGVDSYVWSTSGDERVREDHQELDGQIFQWASPPEPLGCHPGEDFQCRCSAIPVMPDNEDWGD